LQNGISLNGTGLERCNITGTEKSLIRNVLCSSRSSGTTILDNIKVLDIEVSHGTVTGVNTDKRNIQCEYVVNCAGM